ncbi:hypothetical protein SAMN05660337_1010 [Maridesulfovibrio ferrireducens]|uniref:LTXXQ motif family protein n=1 Tax=Maridesulfovibrio ferrireducens TaxID=246191 RepID=A0A1G9E9H1_9BACT|nr:hypothetical protein [Maridesulfovibrio ferrireducens]SDK72793.1 hypothetical protein SAMN05660337_1010 [Maridesulfovibrio ferrireducens]
MLKKTILTFTLILAFASMVSATAPLTSNEIERVIATMEKLEPYMDQMETEMEEAGSHNTDVFDPDMMKKECALIYEYSAQAKKIIKDNGFSAQTWPETSGRVLKAFVSIAMEQEQSAGMVEMQAAMAQMDADPNMPPEQKKMMKEQMNSMMQTAKAMMQAPKADIDAVRPYFEKLTVAVD